MPTHSTCLTPHSLQWGKKRKGHFFYRWQVCRTPSHFSHCSPTSLETYAKQHHSSITAASSLYYCKYHCTVTLPCAKQHRYWFLVGPPFLLPIYFHFDVIARLIQCAAPLTTVLIYCIIW